MLSALLALLEYNVSHQYPSVVPKIRGKTDLMLLTVAQKNTLQHVCENRLKKGSLSNSYSSVCCASRDLWLYGAMPGTR